MVHKLGDHWSSKQIYDGTRKTTRRIQRKRSDQHRRTATKLNRAEMVKLAVRMALANMLRGVKRRKGGVGIFTVVKSAEVVEGKVKWVLRLVFDQRWNNLAWKRPPWSGLSGVGAFTNIT